MIKTFVTLKDKRWEAHRIDFASVVNAVIKESEKRESKIGSREVSIVLTDDSKIRALSKQYRKIDKPTNVLSFETGDAELLGDIFISYDTVAAEAKEQRKSFRDHATHMVVHGVLHLLGYDHIKDGDADIMEGAEVKILKQLGIENPYEESSKFISRRQGCDRQNVQCSNKKIVNRQSEINNQKSVWCQFMPVWMVLAGGIAAFGFAPYYIGFATILGFITLYLFTYHRDGFWRGYTPGFWFGMGYGTVMFYWVLNSIFVDPVIAEQMRVWFMPGLVGIALASGAVFGLPGALTAATGNRSWRRVVSFAAFWVFVLWLREWAFTGFPWNPIANIAMPFPWVANSMSVWGALGLSFILLGLIFSIAHFFVNWRDETRPKNRGGIPFLIFALLLCVAMGSGYLNTRAATDKTNMSPVIRIVQPAVAQSAKLSVQTAMDNVNHLIRLSMVETDGDAPDIVIWPETSYPFMVTNDDFPPSAEIGKTVISGAMSYKGGHVYNSLIVANADGKISDVYDKFHLVPFGEYQPFGKIIPSIGQLAFGPGPDNLTIRTNDNRAFDFAPAICYEIIFSDSLLPKQTTPDFIVNVTNDTWFGTSHGPHQHLDMARRYAIESGLPIVRANYSGISAFVLSDGTVLSRLEIGDVGIIDGAVWGAHATLYRVIGKNWTMVIILILAIGIVTPRRGSRPKGSSSRPSVRGQSLQ